ncbi:CYFA0S06e03620g1_1 [Cyberlindnera fabianii]|uniref:CYFA0S06e03620g1_1 n=1 Tax=Cyberlindnera fabianii TaxID=36022 RepID=A0A061AUE2_CYBFA|nr:CYFA0S06e03620g1_1 [Cyberlindnera fabianii]
MLLHRIWKRTFLVRSFSSGSALLRRFESLEALKCSLPKEVVLTNDQDTTKYLNSFKDVFDYTQESSIIEHNELERAVTCLVLEPRKLSESTFKKILLLKPPSFMLAPLLAAFQKRDTNHAISKDTGMVALRHSLWEADIKNAVKIVDLTSASQQYFEMMKTKRNKTLLKSFVGLCGSVGAIDIILRIFELSPTIGVYGMVLTYIGNLSFFGYLAFGGKMAGKVSHIQWDPSVGANTRFIRADELLMFSKIAEADIHLSNNDGFVSEGLREELEKRDMEPLHPKSDLLLQEYWQSGGDNFEWVEPDQDPADILWKKHIENKKPNLLKGDIKWTDKLITGVEKPATAEHA